jgi:hypothetical protein
MFIFEGMFNNSLLSDPIVGCDRYVFFEVGFEGSSSLAYA